MAKKHVPRNPLRYPRFGDIATFNRLPYVPEIEGENVDVAVLGIPFDGGTTYRPGARFAPRAVRAASALNRNFNPAGEIPVFDLLSAVDAGDVAINPLNLPKTYAAIEQHLGVLHASDARVISVGGDHSVILPILRATAKKHGKDITLVHFDAHTDTNDQAWGEKYHHGTGFRRAVEEGLVKGTRTFQIGMRGPLTSPEDFPRENRFNTLDMDSFVNMRKREAFFEKIRKTAGKGPVYISFDVDAVDPAFCPGTGTPVVGGMTSAEALTCVRKLRGLNIVGADIVEISPPFDHAELTSLLGAALLFEFLSAIALVKK